MTHRTALAAVPGLLAGAAAALVLCGSGLMPGAALAQARDPGDRGRGTPPRRDDPAPRRDDTPTPKRDDTPTPKRDDPAPKRDVDPAEPRRQDPTPPSTPADPAPARDDRRSTGPGDRAPARNDASPVRSPERPASSGAPRNGGGPAPIRNRAFDVFTRTVEGKRYRNGAVLRDGKPVSDARVRPYFADDVSFYPYYAPASDVGLTFDSPYAAYEGVCPPYIDRRSSYYRPPATTYIGPPGDDRDPYRLNGGAAVYDEAARDADLDRALRALRSAFTRRDVNALVDVIDPGTPIAVYRGGRYQYSLDANDYLDMTRDALRAIDTVRLDLSRVYRKADGIYYVGGRHQYRDAAQQLRTVYVSYVLERHGGRYTISQVGAADVARP